MCALTPGGYEAPGSPDRADAMVIHPGTTSPGGDTLPAGGRVLCVTALGESVQAAQRLAYATLEPIRFDGAQLRRDIGHRALDRPGPCAPAPAV